MTVQFFRTAVLVSLLLVHADSGFCNQAEIKIAGGTTASGTMQLLAAEFEKSHPGISVQVFTGVDNSGTVKAVGAGAADIGSMTRPLRGDELKLGLISLEYARTPLAFIAAPDVDVTDVSTNDIVKIYRGETTTWPNGRRIRLVLNSPSDQDTALEKRISPEVSDAVDMADSRTGMMIASSTQDGYEKVKSISGSFSFCPLQKVFSENLSVKILSFNGVLPTVANLKNGSYPLFKPLFVIVKAHAANRVREFIKFLSSPIARNIIEKTGGLSVSGLRNPQK